MIKDRFPDFVPDRMNSKEQQAWLYIDQRPTLIALASSILEDLGEAHELVQELFASLLLKGATFESFRHAEGTLVVATKNRCYDKLRQKMRQKAGYQEFLENHSPDLAEYMEQREEAEEAAAAAKLLVIKKLVMVNQYIERLESLHKEVFVLKWIKRMSYEEICFALQIERQTARNYASQALKMLKAMLKDAGVLSVVVLLILASLLQAFTNPTYLFEIPITIY